MILDPMKASYKLKWFSLDIFFIKHEHFKNIKTIFLFK